jgi:acyl-CoA synthetase (NDP forming)
LTLHLSSQPNVKRPQSLLQARSVAIVGASDSVRWSRILYENLSASFDGPIYLINPRRREIWGAPCYPSFAALPQAVDAAAVLVRADLVVSVLEDGAAHGLKAAIVFASGLGDGEEPESAGRARDLADLAERSGVAICGPNCLGTVSVRERLILFPQEGFRDLEPGGIGAAFQSGGILQFWLQIVSARGGRFSYAISSGNEVNLTLEDYLEFLIQDKHTRVIALFLEGIRRPEQFRRAAARALAVGKPIVAVKTGRSEKGRIVALSHTGAVSGDATSFATFCRAFGVIRCDNLDESADIVLALQHGHIPDGPRLGVVVNSGGLKGLVLDEVDALDIPLSTLGQTTVKAIAPLLTPDLKIENPLDCSAAGALDFDNFSRISIAVGQDPNVDILAIHGVLPTGEPTKAGPDAYRHIAETVHKPVLAFSRMVYSVTAFSRAFQDSAGVPFLQGVPHGMRAVAALGAYAAARRRGAPALPEPRCETGQISEVATALASYGVPLPRQERAISPADAAEIATRIGFPVALKIISAQASHKTEVGAVRLGLISSASVLRAAHDMSEELRSAMPQAHIDHFLVQEMVEGVEMIAGARNDSLCGPIMVIGFGGVLVELLRDTVVELLPVRAVHARELLSRLKAAKLLEGYRGRPAADVDALADSIAALSRFFLDYRHCYDDVEINPLIVRSPGQGVRAVDIRAVKSGVVAAPN